MAQRSKKIIGKEYLIGWLLSVFISFLLIGITSFLYSFFSVENAEVNDYITITIKVLILLAVIILFFMALNFFVPKHADQIRIFSKRIDRSFIWYTNIVFTVLLMAYYIAYIYNKFCIKDVSTFSSVISIVSATIVTPIIKYINDIPTVKVVALNNSFSYNQKSVLELDVDNSIDVTAINNNDDPQAIKFLGFCQGKYVDSIGMNEEGAHNNILLYQYKDEDKKIKNTIETVAPHSQGENYKGIPLVKVFMMLLDTDTQSKVKEALHDHRPSETIKALIKEKTLSGPLFEQEKIFMNVVYENEDGDYFFRPFNIKL